ncbi:DUF4942 domain-containing protein [Hansschlegelia plantiphila]|uniref:N6 adenine-specific DNA methyltransferase N12 class n=1 Tax=Hansschlegelia plantiphila TaxID=374655 RepID=A0A9W6J3Q5_9HYPH|nr:DUF4942 domain-containing protein [Hansschlegelia plantiphila]GLK69201.1 N6 adenine-specific DNA methyltransferase N12 class [Hansschlegelia plantiphila]
MTALIRRVTVHEIVAERNAALAGYQAAHAALRAAEETFLEAHKHSARAMGGTRNSFNDHLDRPGAEKVKLHVDVAPIADFMDVARRVVDAGVWAHVVELTDLQRLMDKKAKDELRQSMTQNPPEVTEDNIFATVENFALQADSIFKRGIAEAFTNLDRRFKSHDGWKVGTRIIMTRAFNEFGSWNYYRNERDTLFDVERTFLVLDGKPPLAGYQSEIAGAIEASRRRSLQAHQSEAETDYFRARCFKNGNLHLWFKRDDLVDRVNRLLGEYYGAPIPQERSYEDDGGLNDPKTSPAARDFAFYPTPEAAADRLLDAVPLYRRHDELEEPYVVLEPSAGSGNLARRLVAKGAVVDCIEFEADRAARLRQAGIYRKIQTADFLRVAPEPVYDRVVMNPPFDRERDIDHVMHAMKFLKPTGALIAIMSAGTEFRETRKSVAFRAHMAQLNATYRDLPAGSFAEAGTYCNTLILKVWADGRTHHG